MRYLMLLALTGCASYVPIDHSRAPPADWPKLEQRVVYTDSPEQLRKYCGASSEASGKYLACSTIHFAAGVCMIYSGTHEAAVVDHERDHCLGYDHAGYSRGPDAWERFKARTR